MASKNARIKSTKTISALESDAVKTAPKQGAPTVPGSFQKASVGQGPRFILQRAQLQCAMMVASELAGTTSVASDFGPYVPELAPIGAKLTLAAQWSNERAKAVAWQTYARSQEVLAWKPVMEALASLKPAFEYALSRNTAIAAKYPSLALFFGLAKQPGQKASRTRHAKKLAAAASTSSAPPTPGATSATGKAA